MNTSMAELEYDTGRIKDASDIVAIVGAYVPLRRSGSQHVGLCPFHKEKTPSFYVHSAKQVYKCHGCGAGGDVFKFLQEIERVDFKQARALLAARVGIKITDRPLTVAERRISRSAKKWRNCATRWLNLYAPKEISFSTTTIGCCGSFSAKA